MFDTEHPPEDVLAQLAGLEAALDASTIPSRRMDRNLLIATWNIRAFGGLVDKWHSAPGDTPKRDVASLMAIAAILARFDVIAVQEVRGNLRALRHALKLLGPSWGMILTDVTQGDAGNDERLAFLFDSRRVKPSGLAGELVLPDSPDDGHPRVRQFARTPYAVSFAAGSDTFVLVTLHVRWGADPGERVGELTAIAEWLARWAHDEADWGHNLLTLGDFNIDRVDDPLYKAFTSTGLTPPAALQDIPRTIFDTGSDRHFYDQIAWFTDRRGHPQLTLDYTGAAGSFDFLPSLKGDLSAVELSWRISDHYPLWVEFATHRATA